MVDDFMVCVDRVITSACFGSVDGGTSMEFEKPLIPITCSVLENGNVALPSKKSSVNNINNNNNYGEGCSSNNDEEILECRICQEDDYFHALEAPCACNGTLKFAHRSCVQRWCNKKGDITCEICNQVFSPNYSLPPPRTNDVMAIDIRQWGPHIDIGDPHFFSLAAAEHHLMQSEYEEYTEANSNSVACLCYVAIVLIILLLIRQTLIRTRHSGIVQESSMFYSFQVSFLQITGFLLPCYVMARSWYIVQNRRRR